MAQSDASKDDDRQLVYQMYMNGAHNGDEFIQSGFNYWMDRTLTNLDHWAAVHRTDPDTLRAVLEKARQTEQRCGASNAAHEIWKFFLALMKDGR